MDHHSQAYDGSGLAKEEVLDFAGQKEVRSEAPDRTRQFVAYTAVAYLISWSIEVPLALAAQGVYSVDLPFSIHYLAAFGPGVAGLLLTWREGGMLGLKELVGRILRWQVAPIWWIVAFSPLLVFFVVAAVMSSVQGVPVDITMLNHFDFLPDIGVAVVLIWLATYGLGEEIGWRGYLLPRLQRSRTAWSSSLVLWAIWATWHGPSFFYLHTVSSAGTLVGFLFGILSGAIVLTWLYNSTGGSVLIVAVWHALFDYVTACTDCKSGPVAATVSTLVMVWAVAVVLFFKPTNLSRCERHVI